MIMRVFITILMMILSVMSMCAQKLDTDGVPVLRNPQQAAVKGRYHFITEEGRHRPDGCAQQHHLLSAPEVQEQEAGAVLLAHGA